MQQTEPRSRHVLKLRAFVDTLAAVGAEKLVRALGVSSNDAQLAMLDVANSICAFSGQNDDGAGPNPAVQSYGQQVAFFRGRAPFHGIPGIRCNGS